MGTRCRSINRAAKRGHFINMYGEYAMRRPFNNRKNTSKRRGVNSRGNTELKKMWSINSLKAKSYDYQEKEE